MGYDMKTTRKAFFLATFATFSLCTLLHGEWQPGLLGGYVEGAFNKTDLPTTLAPYAGPHAATNNTRDVWADKRTWVYRGQIFLDGGPYSFAERNDDSILLKIDGEVLLENTSFATFTKTPIVRLPAGWHEIELRLGNDGGGAGPANHILCQEGFPCAFGISQGETLPAAMNGYSFPADPGDRSLFRHDDGTGFASLLAIATEPRGLPAERLVPTADREDLASGDMIDCSARPAFLDGIHYRCTGYVLETLVGTEWTAPVTNLGHTSFTYRHGETGTRLTWLYEPDGYLLDAAVYPGTGGTLATEPAPDLSDACHSAGTEVVLRATPDAGQRFTSWMGVDAAIPEATVRIDRPRRIRAVFGAPWSYDAAAATITDGNWTLRVKANGTNLTVTGYASATDKAILNLQGPVGDADGKGYRIHTVGGFKNTAGLVSLFLPDTLNRFSNNAFERCPDLETVHPFLPDSVAYVAPWSFNTCEKLTGELFLRNPSVTGIPYYTFQNSRISGLDAPYLQAIDSYAFFNCADLAYVKLPVLRTVNGNGFAKCISLRELRLSDQIERLADNAFSRCTSLETVTPFFPDTLASLGAGAFGDCTKLRGDPVLRNPAIAGALNNVFCNTKITSATFLHGTTIGQYAFTGCSELKTVRIPDETAFIGISAFSNCKKLESVVPFLPDSVTKIASYAFTQCPRLKQHLVIRNPEVGPIADTAFIGSGIISADLSGVTEIKTAFGKCPFLEEVVFGARPVRISGAHAFESAGLGASFYFPGQAMDPAIGEGAFFHYQRGVRNRIYGSLRLDPEGWGRLAEPLTEDDLNDPTYPGKKTFGVLVSAGTRNWLIDWRSPLEPKGTILLLR